MKTWKKNNKRNQQKKIGKFDQYQAHFVKYISWFTQTTKIYVQRKVPDLQYFQLAQT